LEENFDTFFSLEATNKEDSRPWRKRLYLRIIDPSHVVRQDEQRLRLYSLGYSEIMREFAPGNDEIGATQYETFHACECPESPL
jgi:hypothetical protein